MDECILIDQLQILNSTFLHCYSWNYL